MTIGEYKAWVEGFMEGIGNKTPTKEQWKKIHTRLKSVVEDRTTKYIPYPLPYRLTDSPWIGWGTGTSVYSNATDMPSAELYSGADDPSTSSETLSVGWRAAAQLSLQADPR